MKLVLKATRSKRLLVLEVKASMILILLVMWKPR